jgi:hypothetical protein
MNDVAWLSWLLDVCRSALARVENPDFTADPVFVEDLRRYTRQVEDQLEAARRVLVELPDRRSADDG